MPVDAKGREVIYQREVYHKSSLTRVYSDFKNGLIICKIPKNPSVILDLGCGEGIILEKIIKKYPNAKVFGYDLNEESVSICTSLGLPVQKANICYLDIPDNSVDCILFLEVIEHMTNYEDALTEFYRILKPGGRLILMFPNDRTFKIARMLTFKFKEANFNYGHVMQWTPKLMSEVACKMKFQIVDKKFLPLLLWPISLHALYTLEKK